MLSASPKGTVPVLIEPCGVVLEESIDIMKWALQHSSEQLRNTLTPRQLQNQILSLIEVNDDEFKPILDKYKYTHPSASPPPEYFRDSCLDKKLLAHTYLFGQTLSLADIGIFPFIRQFSGVDSKWFEGSQFGNVREWLNLLTSSELFKQVMIKQPPWNPGSQGVKTQLISNEFFSDN